MIKEFISQWDANNGKMEQYFKSSHPGNYADIVKALFKLVLTEPQYRPDDMTIIDNGDYQGTQIFLVPEDLYQPSVGQYVYTNTSMALVLDAIL